MIQKLKNGNTLITLGDGTVFTGNVSAEEGEKPFGIYYSNEKGKTDGAVIIQITSHAAVASYIMSLVRLLDAWEDDEAFELSKTLESLKRDLKPFLPKSK